jgi:hypothetical protein
MRQIVSSPLKMNMKKIKKALSALYYLPASFIERIKLQKLEKTTA